MFTPSKLHIQKVTVWARLVTAITYEPDLTAVILFCAIGLLVTVNVMLRFPELGGIIAQLNQF